MLLGWHIEIQIRSRSDGHELWPRSERKIQLVHTSLANAIMEILGHRFKNSRILPKILRKMVLANLIRVSSLFTRASRELAKIMERNEIISK